MLDRLKEEALRREVLEADRRQAAREADERAKHHKEKKRALQRELAEAKAALLAATQGQSAQVDCLKEANAKLAKDLENLKIEREVVTAQIEGVKAQRDENKRMYETILNVL